MERIIALGFFDGVHLGHAAILEKTRRLAQEKGFLSAAITFQSHPRAFVLGVSPPMITTFKRRMDLILEQGIDGVIALPFDEQMANMNPLDFIAMLKNEYSCAGVVCGRNFRFGSNASGTPETFKEQGDLLVSVCPPVMAKNGGIISSTAIRRLISAGDISEANRYLGRSFAIDGTVVHGTQMGRHLGFPTINTRPESGILLPLCGVYAGYVTVCGKRFKAVTCVGTRPTFSDADIISIESYILGFSGNLYSETATVEFVRFIRSERCFSNGDELKRQIALDVLAAEAIM